MPLVLVCGRVIVQEAEEYRIQNHYDHYEHIDDIRSVQVPYHGFTFFIKEVGKSVDEESRYKEQYMVGQSSFNDIAVPSALLQFSALFRYPYEALLNQPVESDSKQYYSGGDNRSVQQLSECVRQSYLLDQQFMQSLSDFQHLSSFSPSFSNFCATAKEKEADY